VALLSDIEHVEAVLRRRHGLLEAPRIADRGAFVYSDVLGGGVFRAEADGEVVEVLAKRRGIGGIVAHGGGGWVVSGRTILHIDAGGEQREILLEDGFCGFNDLGVAPDGSVLAGALRYRPLAGEDERPGALLSISAPGRASVLSEAVTWPNGVGVSPDGRTIYISDYARGTVLAIPAAGGEASEFARAPRGSTDGLALDAEGGVWVALGEGAAIARFRPDGSLDEVADVPARFVSSLSFGGPDMRDVLITTADNLIEERLGGSVLRARSGVEGLPVAPARV
jgi:sugar lactone lactonase YvrE